MQDVLEFVLAFVSIVFSLTMCYDCGRWLFPLHANSSPANFHKWSYWYLKMSYVVVIAGIAFARARHTDTDSFRRPAPLKSIVIAMNYIHSDVCVTHCHTVRVSVKWACSKYEYTIKKENEYETMTSLYEFILATQIYVIICNKFATHADASVTYNTTKHTKNEVIHWLRLNWRPAILLFVYSALALHWQNEVILRAKIFHSIVFCWGFEEAPLSREEKRITEIRRVRCVDAQTGRSHTIRRFNFTRRMTSSSPAMRNRKLVQSIFVVHIHCIDMR